MPPKFLSGSLSTRLHLASSRSKNSSVAVQPPQSSPMYTSILPRNALRLSSAISFQCGGQQRKRTSSSPDRWETKSEPSATAALTRQSSSRKCPSSKESHDSTLQPARVSRADHVPLPQPTSRILLPRQNLAILSTALLLGTEYPHRSRNVERLRDSVIGHDALPPNGPSRMISPSSRLMASRSPEPTRPREADLFFFRN